MKNSTLEFLPTNTEDLQSIMNIIHEAQAYLASLAIDQWQDGYPNENLILNDISNSESFLVKDETNNVMATTMFTTNPESTYETIEGSWLTGQKDKYGVIHRMAVGRSYRKLGLAKFIFSKCEMKLKESGVKSMRIDTHEDNIGMQNLIKGLGYVYCGVIYLVSGDKRLAFEKIIG